MKLKNFFPLLSFLPMVSAVIKGVNLFGLETPTRQIDCSWHRPSSHYINELHTLGFNYIRLPFSLEYVNEDNWGSIDEIFETVSQLDDLSICLDMHRVFSSHQGESPLEGGTSLTEFVDGWIKILDRYKEYEFLRSVDIFNEYQGTDIIFWNSIASQIVEKIEEAFPGRFHFFVGGSRWGGSLEGIDLEALPFSDRISYTIHKYIFSGNSNPSDWETSFGKFKNKVSVGEWGFFSDRPDQVEWAKTFIEWLRFHKIQDSFFWCLVANSGDTGGLYATDCETFDWYKFNIIETLWSNSSSITPTFTSNTRLRSKTKE